MQTLRYVRHAVRLGDPEVYERNASRRCLLFRPTVRASAEFRLAADDDEEARRAARIDAVGVVQELARPADLRRRYVLANGEGGEIGREHLAQLRRDGSPVVEIHRIDRLLGVRRRRRRRGIRLTLIRRRVVLRPRGTVRAEQTVYRVVHRVPDRLIRRVSRVPLGFVRYALYQFVKKSHNYPPFPGSRPYLADFTK